MLPLVIDAIIAENYHKATRLLLSLPQVTHKQQVSFAYNCAIDAPKVADEIAEEKRMKCLQLVATWLEDASKVTQKQLIDAANAADTHAAYVARAARYAATHAAHAAAHAADTAAYAAACAANADFAATAAAYNTKMRHYLKQLIRQLNIPDTKMLLLVLQ